NFKSAIISGKRTDEPTYMCCITCETVVINKTFIGDLLSIGLILYTYTQHFLEFPPPDIKALKD
ncbi:MAG: hypothetical protein QXV23_07640, partial [Candidatus Bathyarchaeia archaeon]